MQSKVQIMPDDLGNVIRVSKNNPDYAHVRIVQEKVGFGSNGWVKKTTLSTLIHGTVEDLEAIGIAKKKTLPGKIVVKESLDPFSSSNPDRDMKIAGETGVICVQDDQPIYRKTFYVINDNEQDVLLQHTNGDEIREAQGSSVDMTNIKATQNVSNDDLANIQKDIAKQQNDTDDVVEEEVVVDEKEEVEEEESFEL